MANEVKTEAAAKRYAITVTSNPNYCGVDVCGVQFSNGKAETDNARAASWFTEHDGYDVSEIAEAKEG